MPGESEVFELTLDGDAPENHPIGMVLRLGSGEGLIPMESMNPFWFMVLHRGPVINGVQTRSFMWLSNQRLGRPKDLASVRIACEKHGKIPEGQWIEAFKMKFRPDGTKRGIADPSWIQPTKRAEYNFEYAFPAYSHCGASEFVGDYHPFEEDLTPWFWLIEVKRSQDQLAIGGGTTRLLTE